MPQGSLKLDTEAGRGFERSAQVIVVSYAVGAVLYKFTSGASGNPAWMMGLSVLAGGASVFAHRRLTESRTSPSARWILVPILTLLTGRQLLLLYLGSTFMVYGAIGLVTGRIESEGRSGPPRTSSGGAARFSSIMWILSGGAAAAWAVLQE